ncbi:unnamed protein product [Cochlearia groenlandica]
MDLIEWNLECRDGVYVRKRQSQGGERGGDESKPNLDKSERRRNPYESDYSRDRERKVDSVGLVLAFLGVGGCGVAINTNQS